MGEFEHRDHRIPEQIVRPMSADDSECRLEGIMPRSLLLAIREALDGGHGRLRCDPEELAKRIGAAIDLEIERLAELRAKHLRKKHQARMSLQPELFFGGAKRGMLAPTPEALAAEDEE